MSEGLQRLRQVEIKLQLCLISTNDSTKLNVGLLFSTGGGNALASQDRPFIKEAVSYHLAQSYSTRTDTQVYNLRAGTEFGLHSAY